MSRIATALEKERARNIVREWLGDIVINAALAIGAGHYWLGAPWWGAWIIFAILQHSDNERRARKYAK